MAAWQPKCGMRVAVDVTASLRTPLRAPGRYAQELVAALNRSSDLDLVLGTWSGRRIGPRALLSRRSLAEHYPDDRTELWRNPPDRIDVFHATGSSQQWPGRGLVVTVHGIPMSLGFDVRDRDSRQRIMGHAEKLLGQAARVQCASPQVALDLMDHYGVLRDRIDVVPPAVHPDFFAPSGVAPNLIDWPSRYLITYGAPAQARNIDTVLHAWAESDLRNSHHLVVLGGPKARSCLATVETLGLRDRVFLPHVLDRADMPNALANSDGLILPASYEGTGLPLLEAMAAGVPVLTSHEGTCKAVSGGHALLVHGEDVAAVTRGINQLVTAPPDVQKARAWARTHDWDSHVWRVLASYDRVAESGR